MWSLTAIFNRRSANIAMSMMHWIGNPRLLFGIVPLLPIEESLKPKDSLSMPNVNYGCPENDESQREKRKKINRTITTISCLRFVFFFSVWAFNLSFTFRVFFLLLMPRGFVYSLLFHSSSPSSQEENKRWLTERFWSVRRGAVHADFMLDNHEIKKNKIRPARITLSETRARRKTFDRKPLSEPVDWLDLGWSRTPSND